MINHTSSGARAMHGCGNVSVKKYFDINYPPYIIIVQNIETQLKRL